MRRTDATRLTGKQEEKSVQNSWLYGAPLPYISFLTCILHTYINSIHTDIKLDTVVNAGKINSTNSLGWTVTNWLPLISAIKMHSKEKRRTEEKAISFEASHSNWWPYTSKYRPTSPFSVLILLSTLPPEFLFHQKYLSTVVICSFPNGNYKNIFKMY